VAQRYARRVTGGFTKQPPHGFQVGLEKDSQKKNSALKRGLAFTYKGVETENRVRSEGMGNQDKKKGDKRRDSELEKKKGGISWGLEGGEARLWSSKEELPADWAEKGSSRQERPLS